MGLFIEYEFDNLIEISKEFSPISVAVDGIKTFSFDKSEKVDFSENSILFMFLQR